MLSSKLGSQSQPVSRTQLLPRPYTQLWVGLPTGMGWGGPAAGHTCLPASPPWLLKFHAACWGFSRLNWRQCSFSPSLCFSLEIVGPSAQIHNATRANVIIFAKFAHAIARQGMVIKPSPRLKARTNGVFAVCYLIKRLCKRRLWPFGRMWRSRQRVHAYTHIPKQPIRVEFLFIDELKSTSFKQWFWTSDKAKPTSFLPTLIHFAASISSVRRQYSAAQTGLLLANTKGLAAYV